MAFGAQRYMDQAIALARSFRKHMPGRRLCLVTDREIEDQLFDDVVIMDPIGIPGTILKIRLHEYSPYEETFFIDSDCIVLRDFSEHVERMRAWDFTPVCNSYLRAGDDDLWLSDVGASLEKVGGVSFPKFNGGVYFFRRCDFTKTMFAKARDMLDQSKALGILDFDSAGPGDETVIGMALAQMHAGPLYDDDFDLMRTPLNSKGTITADPILGRSRMLKNGREMSPAIMHFCGPYAHHPAYLQARRMLEKGRHLSPMEKFNMQAAWRWRKVSSQISGRMPFNTP